MAVIKFESKGSFKNMESFLTKASRTDVLRIMEAGAKEGVAALAAATPVESGLAASSWSYQLEARRGRYTIYWTNSDIENGFPVVIALQYGYGTGTGGYVQGRDFINPALRPVFDRIANTVWKAVTAG